MSITQIPPKGPLPSPSPAARPDGSELYEPQRWESAYRKFDADNVPHLLIQLQDDLARSRKREAVWLSVIFHLLVVILVVNEAKLEKYLPRHAVIVVSPNDWTRQKELTYLELPPDFRQRPHRQFAQATSRSQGAEKNSRQCPSGEAGPHRSSSVATTATGTGSRTECSAAAAVATGAARALSFAYSQSEPDGTVAASTGAKEQTAGQVWQRHVGRFSD